MAGFRFNINKLKKLQAIIASPSGAAQMRPLYERWGTRYLSSMKRKFVENSTGGGDWPPSKWAYMREARRIRKSGKKIRYKAGKRMSPRISILVDTGTLRRGLDIGAPGNLFQPHLRGIRVGYSGGVHPKSKSALIGEIASFHNSGTGRLPQRQIIWPPDDNVKSFMLRSLREHINSIGQSL